MALAVVSGGRVTCKYVQLQSITVLTERVTEEGKEKRMRSYTGYGGHCQYAVTDLEA